MIEKTAMQTVIEAIENVAVSGINGYTTISIKTNDLNKLLSESLELEKQQIIVSWQDGYIEGLKDGVADIVNDSTGDDYYNETYKQM